MARRSGHVALHLAGDIDFLAGALDVSFLAGAFIKSVDSGEGTALVQTPDGDEATVRIRSKYRDANEYLLDDSDNTVLRVYRANGMEGIPSAGDFAGNYVAVMREVDIIIPSANRDSTTNGISVWVNESDGTKHQIYDGPYAYASGSLVLAFPVSAQAANSLQSTIATTPGRISFTVSFDRDNAQVGPDAIYEMPIHPHLQAPPAGDGDGDGPTQDEFDEEVAKTNRTAQDVAHNRNLLADMEQEEFVRWAAAAPGDGAFLVFPSSAGGSYSQTILQAPDPTDALSGVGWVNQWARPDPGASPGYDVTDVNAWQNLFSIIVRLKHRTSQADFRVLLPGALRNSPIGLLSSSHWVSFHSDDDWDYYLYSVASALSQNVSLLDLYTPVGDGYTLQSHGPQRHTTYRGKVQALEEYDPHSPRRVTQLPHVMLEDEILVLTQDALHPATEQRWSFTPDWVLGYDAETSLYTNRYYGVALPNVVDTSVGDTSGSPRNNGAAGWGSNLSAIFQTAGIRAMYARTTEENTLYLVVDKGLISDADAASPENYRLSLLLPLDGGASDRSSFWSRSVIADAITTQATTRTLTFTITNIRDQLVLQSLAVTIAGGVPPSLSLRHNTDYLRINSGVVEFSGAGVAMPKGLYHGRPDGTPEHVIVTHAPLVLQAAVAGSNTAGVTSITLPANYTDYLHLSVVGWATTNGRLLEREYQTAVLALQAGDNNGDQSLGIGAATNSRFIAGTWNRAARTFTVSGSGNTGCRIIYAALED